MVGDRKFLNQVEHPCSVKMGWQREDKTQDGKSFRDLFTSRLPESGIIVQNISNFENVLALQKGHC